jgi:class 3 adenylate cyclase
MTVTALVCGSCGTALPPNWKFCNECGAPVATATTPAEYKQVTVLFADVVHSMDIAAAVGAERLREIMADLADRCAAVVQRFGGTVDKFTGDGIMAVFGAPVALEDHAVRACLAALSVREEAKRLAVEVHGRDGVDLQLRVGLNSGQVIAGDIGSGPFGYTTIGEQVGMAQRMESAAPPGGVMLTESTARLVEHTAELAEPELVRIKGRHDPVPARALLRMNPDRSVAIRHQPILVGRDWEMAAIEGVLARSIEGRGAVISLVGPAGIGKTRLVGEAETMARSREVDVFSTYCESHATDVPFHVVTRLLRAAFRVNAVDKKQSRTFVRERLPDADAEDRLLLEDLLGIADEEVALPNIDPDARRRRLTALVNAATLARTTPAMFVVEDAHWIDEASESLLAGFLAVVPQTPTMVVVTQRPDYDGPLSRIAGGQTIALSPLSDSETTALITEQLGSDASVDGLATTIAERAGGNPFFAEELIRDLRERRVLQGLPGSYVRSTDAPSVLVPPTLQATIAARIDRLVAEAKRTLNAAAVIGARFTPELLTDLGIDPALDDLMKAELIDQVGFTRYAEYAFRHPLIRAVAYESQLKSDRSEWHRRVAAAIEAGGSPDERAALIAQHLDAAGELEKAYAWQMRAGGWSQDRDVAAARACWDRASQLADALSDDGPHALAKRIAPRALLCGSGWRVHVDISGLLDELRNLCALAGDKRALAMGMAGLVTQHLTHGRVREGSRLASELMALLESIEDSTLMLGLSGVSVLAKYYAGEFADILRWSQTVVELAQANPTSGGFFWGSPLATALAHRGSARCALGHPGWREDFDRAVATARGADAITHTYVVGLKNLTTITCGALLPDETAVHEAGEALEHAEGSADDTVLNNARLTLGITLVHRDSRADRDRGVELLSQVREMCMSQRYFLSNLPGVIAYIARENARRGDRDGAIPVMRTAVDDVFRSGEFGPVVWVVAVLVETLLERGSEGDVADAQAIIDRLATEVTEDSVIRDIMLLRLRTVLARTVGDESAYRELRRRYRAMVNSLGFEGHMVWAEAMP